jgi:BASS family bile acid:Na+ symporter
MPDAVLLFTGLVIFAQMVDIGLRQGPGDLARLFGQPLLLLRSLLSVLVIVPLAAAVLVATLPVPPEVALGLVLLAAAPGAPLTTRRSQMAGADDGYVSALQLTLAALAVVFMPAAIAAFGTVLDPSVPIPAPGKVAGQIATVTVLPLALGWLFASFAPGVLRRHAPRLSRLSKLLFVAFALVVLLALAFVPDLRAKLLIGWPGAAALAAMAAVALAAGHLLGGPRADRRGGLATASVARNLGLALFVAESAPETVDAIPTILSYALLGILLALPYSLWIKGRVAAVTAGDGPAPG